MKTIMLNFREDERKLLKQRGLLYPTNKNNLFDILAERAMEYYINIPKSKYHKLVMTEVPLWQHFNMDISDESLGIIVTRIKYDNKKFPKLTETYLKNYLLKQLEN